MNTKASLPRAAAALSHEENAAIPRVRLGGRLSQGVSMDIKAGHEGGCTDEPDLAPHLQRLRCLCRDRKAADRACEALRECVPAPLDTICACRKRGRTHGVRRCVRGRGPRATHALA